MRADDGLLAAGQDFARPAVPSRGRCHRPGSVARQRDDCHVSAGDTWPAEHTKSGPMVTVRATPIDRIRLGTAQTIAWPLISGPCWGMARSPHVRRHGRASGVGRECRPHCLWRKGSARGRRHRWWSLLRQFGDCATPGRCCDSGWSSCGRRCARQDHHRPRRLPNKVFDRMSYGTPLPARVFRPELGHMA